MLATSSNSRYVCTQRCRVRSSQPVLSCLRFYMVVNYATYKRQLLTARSAKKVLVKYPLDALTWRNRLWTIRSTPAGFSLSLRWRITVYPALTEGLGSFSRLNNDAEVLEVCSVLVRQEESSSEDSAILSW